MAGLVADAVKDRVAERIWGRHGTLRLSIGLSNLRCTLLLLSLDPGGELCVLRLERFRIRGLVGACLAIGGIAVI